MKIIFSVLRSKAVKVSTAASALALAGSAHAASVLPTGFNFDDVSADITTVGGGLIGLAVVAVGIKWVKATFFG